MSADAWLSAVEARAAAATPGPWIVNPEHYAPGDENGSPHDEQVISMHWGHVCDLAWHDGDTQIPDAVFIAAARSDLPALVAFARAVLALCDAAESEPDDYAGAHPARLLVDDVLAAADEHLKDAP